MSLYYTFHCASGEGRKEQDRDRKRDDLKQTGPLQRFQSSGKSGKSRIKSWPSPQRGSVPAEEGTSADTDATRVKSYNSVLTEEPDPEGQTPPESIGNEVARTGKLIETESGVAATWTWGQGRSE